MALSEITNYLEDDWDDNSLTGRTSPTEGYFLHPSDGLISDMEAGDALKGVYRPEWNVENGSGSATNQRLELPDGSSTAQRIVVNSDFSIGSWEHDWEYLTSSSSNVAGLCILVQDFTDTNNSTFDTPDDCYQIDFNDADKDFIGLTKLVGGSRTTVISSSGTSSSSTGTVFTVKGTRDSFGNWELFQDSTSQGTGTDTTFTDGEWLVIHSNLNGQVAYDNLKVI